MSQSTVLRVGEVMSREVRTIDRMATVHEAMGIMAESGLSSLVIERRDDDDELGLVVIADIAGQVIAAQRSPERVNVYEVMSKPVITLPEEMDIKYGIRLLVRFELSRALVVDHDRKLCGLVTLRDMVLRYGEREPR